jgi:hypothetical protein
MMMIMMVDAKHLHLPKEKKNAGKKKKKRIMTSGIG